MSYKQTLKFILKQLGSEPKSFEQLREELYELRNVPELKGLHWVMAGSHPWSEELTEAITDLIASGAVESERNLVRRV